LRLKRKSGVYPPPQVTKFGVNNLQERMLEDYDPKNKDYYNQRSTEDFVESFLSQAVTIPKEDDEDLTPHSSQPQSGFLGRCAHQAQVFLPVYTTVTVSLGKVVDWLKSAR